jgi:hypothetical protein
MIPISTHLITVERPTNADTRDPETGTAETWETVDTDVRAVIADGGGAETGPGATEVVRFTLLADPVELDQGYRVTDQATSATYPVTWAVHTPGVAGQLASVRAGLTTIRGAA